MRDLQYVGGIQTPEPTVWSIDVGLGLRCRRLLEDALHDLMESVGDRRIRLSVAQEWDVYTGHILHIEARPVLDCCPHE